MNVCLTDSKDLRNFQTVCVLILRQIFSQVLEVSEIKEAHFTRLPGLGIRVSAETN